MSHRFDLKSKAIFLTYSQVNEDGQREFSDDPTKHARFVGTTLSPPICYRLGREHHVDEGIHYHVYVSWEQPQRIRDQHKLDFGGTHPNIKSVRGNNRRCWDYTGKDGDVLHEFGNVEEPSNRLQRSTTTYWATAISAETKDAFFETLRDNCPRDFVIFKRQIHEFADWWWAPPPKPYISPTFTRDTTPELDDWIAQSGIGSGGHTGRPRSLILWGPTRTGKTVWARSLGELTSLGRHRRRDPPPLRGAPPTLRRFKPRVLRTAAW